MLTQIDRQSGDGDHGINMALGFSALKEKLDDVPEDIGIAGLFRIAGTTLVDSMGGASGVIFGTLFIAGISALNRPENMTLPDFILFFESGAKAIMKRGRAKAGDKTMLDALLPAVEGLETSGKPDLESAFAAAAEKAREGFEKTKTMKAKIGRAKAFANQPIECPDAGAASISIIFNAMSEYINRQE